MANQSSMYKKFVVGAASAALVASAVAPVVSAASFSDVKGNTHETAINALTEAGVINGYEDGTYKPNKTLTRSDVVKLMGKWLVTEGKEIPEDARTNPRFTDLKTTSNGELLDAAAVVFDNGVFNGNKGELLPADNITRENMAVVIVRAFDQLNGIDLVSYVAAQDFDKDVIDLGKAKAEARAAIDVLDYFDITNPIAPSFNPKGSTTRGHFATFLHKTINTDFSEVIGDEVVDADQVAVEAAADQVIDGAVTVLRGEHATNENKLEAVEAYVDGLVTEDGVVATIVAGETANDFVVTLTKGEAEEVKDIAVTFELTDDLFVTTVSAITPTAIEINFTALEADDEAVKVTVLDGNDVEVATKPVAVSAGETTITVEFETAVKEADLVGVWTVNGKEYNLDAANQLEAILAATSDLPLYNALEAASIKNVDENFIKDYLTAIEEAEELTSLEAVQAIIDEVNADNVSAGKAIAIAKEVYSATNAVTFSKALTGNFDRVNTAWVTAYETAVDTVFEGITATTAINESNAPGLLEDIQEAIDAENLVGVATKWAEVESSIDTSKFTAVKTLIDTYKVSAEEGEVNEYDYFSDVLDYQTAIATATTASTNSALLSALTKVDTLLDQNTEKYAGKTLTVAESSITGFKAGLDSFDIETVKTDSSSLTAYRAAIKAETVAGNKNQAKDLEALIDTVNTTKTNQLLTAVETADTAFVSGTASTEKALLDAIKAVAAHDATAFADVNIVDSRVALYADQITTVTTIDSLVSAIDTANTGATSGAFTAVDDATDAATLLTALKSPELALNGVTDANAAAYFADAADIKAADTVANLNASVKQVNALVAINKSTTATAVQTELATFGSTDYLNVPTADRAIVAQLVLDTRNDTNEYATKQFANVADVTDVLDKASQKVVSLLTYINTDISTDTATAVATEFKTAGLTGFDSSTTTISIEEADLAQAFLNSLTFDTTGNNVTPKFVSLAKVNEALAAL